MMRIVGEFVEVNQANEDQESETVWDNLIINLVSSEDAKKPPRSNNRKLPEQ